MEMDMADGPAPDTDDKTPPGQDPAGDAPPTGTPPAEEPLPTGFDSWPPEAQEAVRATRREAAKYRTERNGLKDKVTEAERAQMTAQQKAEADAQAATARADAAEAKVRDIEARDSVAKAATEKWKNPATAAALAMASGALTFGEDGKPSNITAVLNDLAKTHPDLLKTPPAGGLDGGAGSNGGSGQAPSMNDLIRGGARSGSTN
jgi:membrane protein involved in colicin uptake